MLFACSLFFFLCLRENLIRYRLGRPGCTSSREGRRPSRARPLHRVLGSSWSLLLLCDWGLAASILPSVHIVIL